MLKTFWIENQTVILISVAVIGFVLIAELTRRLFGKSAKAVFLQQRADELLAENTQLRDENMNLNVRYAALEAQMREESRHLRDKIEELKQVKEELTLQFKNISADILKIQGADFQKTQQETLVQMLSPFKDQLDTFKKRMEEINQVNAEDKGKMDQQLHYLMQMNQTLSEDAKDLANALKGNSKHQGDWGETQLERIFEVAGFVKGLHYTTQENVKDEEGNNKRPDYIVKLPNDRRLIVDCKVSLNAYTRWIKAETPEEKKKFLTEHTQALRQHIKGLASKSYQADVKGQGLDYVFMFIPIEHAYIEALRAEPDIYEAAYQNSIAVTTASSLLPILRTVENLWRIEKQNRNVLEIAETGGKLYDKLAGFVADMQGIERNLDRAKDSYSQAIKKLSEGRGNALSLAERLKEQGAKTAKEIGVSTSPPEE